MIECYKVYGKSAIGFPSFEMYFYCVVHEPIFFSKTENIFMERIQKQPPEVFYKKAVLINFAIFTRKHLCSSLF